MNSSFAIFTMTQPGADERIFRKFNFNITETVQIDRMQYIYHKYCFCLEKDYVAVNQYKEVYPLRSGNP